MKVIKKKMEPQDVECPAVFFMLFAMQREKGDSSLTFSIRFVFRRNNDKTNDEQSHYKCHKQNHSNRNTTNHRVSPFDLMNVRESHYAVKKATTVQQIAAMPAATDACGICVLT